MKTLFVVFLSLMFVVFLYKFEEKCAKFKEVTIFEEDGVRVIDKVKVYECSND